MRPLYRLRQLSRALRPRLNADDVTLVAELLSPAEQRLFAAMTRFDQQHAVDVCCVLQAAGQRDEALLRAALLHDCGKVDARGRPIPLLYYGLFVLLQRLAPRLYRAAAASGRGPLGPFRTHAEHELRSARLVAEAGSPPEIVAIIASYHVASAGSAGAWLRWADDQC